MEIGKMYEHTRLYDNDPLDPSAGYSYKVRVFTVMDKPKDLEDFPHLETDSWFCIQKLGSTEKQWITLLPEDKVREVTPAGGEAYTYP